MPEVTVDVHAKIKRDELIEIVRVLLDALDAD